MHKMATMRQVQIEADRADRDNLSKGQTRRTLEEVMMRGPLQVLVSTTTNRPMRMAVSQMATSTPVMATLSKRGTHIRSGRIPNIAAWMTALTMMAMR
jgi:hypothetical protein